MTSPSASESSPRPDLSDMRPTNDWVARYLPASWGPYARLCRLDRPVGTWLTLLPALAALVQAADGLPTLWRVVIFSLGALLMRGIGCCFNDMADRNFDHQVERTRFRPLTSGQLTMRKAVIFVLAQMAVCALLLFAINEYSRWLALALFPIVMIYPLCKRFTYWPQVVLGICFNWGMLMAWSDTQNIVPLGAILMWVGAILWQVGYDSIYAYIDVADDTKLGLHSTALRFREAGKTWISGFYIAAMLCWLVGGLLLDERILYYAVMALIGAHLLWQMKHFDVRYPERGLRLFRANIWVGVLLVVAALAGTISLV